MIRSTFALLQSTTYALRPSRSALCLLVLVCLSPLAWAQVGADLPRSIVEAISIPPAQRGQIEEFIASWADRATNDDPQDNKRAMEALTKPLQSRGVSVAFRQAYAQAVEPLMKTLSEREGVGASLSALRIAGELATPAMVTRVREGMNDEDPGVRLFAVSRAGRIFSATASHGPAITNADAVSLIGDLAKVGADAQIGAEMTRACVRALSQGTALSSKDLGDARSRAIIALADIVGARLQALGNSDDPAFAQSLALEAASAVTRSISDIGSTVTPEAARAAVVLGGDIISLPLRRVLGKTVEPVAERDLTVKSVQAGETLLYFARRKAAELGGEASNSILTTAFSDQLAKGSDRQFRDDASVLLGPGSDLLTRFKIEPERFLR